LAVTATRRTVELWDLTSLKRLRSLAASSKGTRDALPLSLLAEGARVPNIPDGYKIVAALLKSGNSLEDGLIAALGKEGAGNVRRFGPEGRRLLSRFEWAPNGANPGDTVRVYFPKVASPKFTWVKINGRPVWSAGTKDTAHVLSGPISLPKAAEATTPLLAVRVWNYEAGSFVPEGVDNVYILRQKATK
jgi:hypothetical protein